MATQPGHPGRAYALRIGGYDARERTSFVVLGDTGEGDASQMAVVPGLLKAARGTDFAVICSDVVYPAGECKGYPAKFHCPYRDLPGPIYAVPGNHDWYDRLTGFMTQFGGAQHAPAGDVWSDAGPQGWLASILWRGGGAGLGWRAGGRPRLGSLLSRPARPLLVLGRRPGCAGRRGHRYRRPDRQAAGRLACPGVTGAARHAEGPPDRQAAYRERPLRPVPDCRPPASRAAADRR